MKKLGKFIILLSMVLLCGLVNLIVFLTIDQARLETTAFWVAWGFATPWTLLSALVLHLWAGKKQGEEVLRMPVAYYLCAIFGVLYLVVGLIFMYANIETLTALIIIEAIITVIYLIAVMYSMNTTDSIAKEEKVTKQKVFFIRMLASNVNTCLPMATDETVRAQLETLADNIRFSDPMSHQALAVIEGELANTIDEITLKLTDGNQDVSALIKKAEMQLSRRNAQCAMLK
ncbi:MAG: hypothetical protein E7371_01185 [Clostridiales bacterium]|nr:hypothetical protein [Clostridiales bacterium]